MEKSNDKVDCQKYWSLYYAQVMSNRLTENIINVGGKNRSIKIITASGIIEGTFCSDPYAERDKSELAEKTVLVYKNAAGLCFPNDPKAGSDITFPACDAFPVLLKDVTINGTKLPYMLMFPNEIIGVSL